MKHTFLLILLLFSALVSAQQKTPSISPADQQKLLIAFKEYADAAQAAEAARLKFVATKYQVMSENTVNSLEWDMIPSGDRFVYQAKVKSNVQVVPSPSPTPAKSGG